MAIFNIANENEFQARMKMFMCDDIFQLNRDTNIYERVGHSGGPDPITELPYYLKANSIKVENSTISNTVMDSNSFDVVDVAGEKSSSLLSDRLVLGDTDGNAELDKPKLELLDELNTGMVVSTPEKSTVNTVFPVVYDSVNKKFIKSTGFKIGQNLNQITFSDTGSATFGRDDNISTIGVGGFSHFNGTVWTNITQSSFKVRNTTGTFPMVFLDNDNLKIGSSTNSSTSVFDNTKDSITVNKNAVSLYDAASTATSTLDINSFKTLNKLRDVVVGTLNDDAKMILYNPITKQFCYYDIWRPWMSANDLQNRTAGNPLSSLNRVLMHEAGTGAFSYVNLNDTFAAANKIRDMTLDVVDANKRMVIYDATTTNISYAPIPSGSGTLPPYIYSDKIEMASSGDGYIKTQNPVGSGSAAITKTGVLELTNAAGQRNDLDSLGVKWVNDNKNINRKYKIIPYDAADNYFTKVNDGLTALASATAIKSIEMADNDELFIVSDTGYQLKYNTWYLFRISSNYNWVVDARVVYDGLEDNKKDATPPFDRPYIIIHKNPNTIPGYATAPAGSFCFKLANTDATLGSGSDFKGTIGIKMLTTSIVALPNASVT